MLIASLLAEPSNIHCLESTISSKKRLLETLSEYLASNTQPVTANEIFQALLDRERLGSTGLGKGVAIPHARIEGINETTATMITLNKAINYEAVDKLPVDIIFGLLVPIDSDDYHLEHLARIAKVMRNPTFCDQIRTINNPKVLFNTLLAVDDD